jgi:SAM-dependent methyltransferase
MQPLVNLPNYEICATTRVFSRPGFAGTSYSDGDWFENNLFNTLKACADLSVLSPELKSFCVDWPSTYHLSASRANLLRPFEECLKGNVLEIGAGCGAITRYLGECGANVVAVEGSLRRAAIARERTRELTNVSIICDNILSLEPEPNFHVVLLVGVLEYASLFGRSAHPELDLLEHAKRFLAPGGFILLAIENQFGLKYFAGAPEDHIGQKMYGIENRYENGQARTFGRKVLKGMFDQLGFGTTKTFAPFPDYKLPSVVFTENAFLADDFAPETLVIPTVSEDPQQPIDPFFNQAATWPTLIKNGLGLDLANSLLIMAGRDKVEHSSNDNILAWHFSTARHKQFCKATIFTRDAAGGVVVETKPLWKTAGLKRQDSFLMHKAEHFGPYVSGSALSMRFAKVLQDPAWSFVKISGILSLYLNTATKILRRDGIHLCVRTPHQFIPGRYLDLVPANIIIDQMNEPVFIDTEWILQRDLSVGFLVFRALFDLVYRYRRGIPASLANVIRSECYSQAVEPLGWQPAESDLLHYAICEAEIQRLVAFNEVDGRFPAAAKQDALGWLAGRLCEAP